MGVGRRFPVAVPAFNPLSLHPCRSTCTCCLVSCLPCAAWAWRRATFPNPSGTHSRWSLRQCGGWCCGSLSTTGPHCSPRCSPLWPTCMRTAMCGMTSQTSSSTTRALPQSNVTLRDLWMLLHLSRLQAVSSCDSRLAPPVKPSTGSCLLEIMALKLQLLLSQGSIFRSKSTDFQIPLGTLEWWNKWPNQIEKLWAWF